MKRLIAALALLLAPVPLVAQDSITTSTAPAPTQIRLPLVRTVADGTRVVLQVVGATETASGSQDGQYIGPNGYVAAAADAQDIRGPAGGGSSGTQIPGPMGAPGRSAYEIWLDAGNEGTLAAYLASLKGDQGIPGGTGPSGSSGTDGKSAYQLWLDAGNTGTAAQFLASLQGQRGETGAPGSAGTNGVDGNPAQMRVNGGFIQWSNGGAWQNLVATTDLVGDKGEKGDPGQNGTNGTNGQAATISVGSVHTGAPGTPVTVTNTGNSSAASFSFTIPAGFDGGTGPKGDPGSTPNLTIGTVQTLAPGAQATAAISGTIYAPVLSLGLPAGQTGQVGATGTTGATGSTGATGATGQTGTAATVAVGTVTTLAAGSNPTVTNGGTSSAAVLNFGLPRSAVYLTDVTLSQTAVVAIALGPRTITVSTNCQVGDRMFMSPAAAMPAGYMLGDIFCSATGTAQATLYAPLLAIGASYSITVKVTAFR